MPLIFHEVNSWLSRILFRTADLSAVKKYFTDQCTKIMNGNVSIQDFCFSKAVKMGTYSGASLPPGAQISLMKMRQDARAEPQYGERVPYVVIAGARGSRLVDRCVAPEVMLGSDEIFLDAEYYITKNLIPPLERILNLVGANVRQWYDEMPKVVQMQTIISTRKKTLHSYLKSSLCVVCRREKAANGGMYLLMFFDLQRFGADLFRYMRGMPKRSNEKLLCCSKSVPGTRTSAEQARVNLPIMYENCLDGGDWMYIDRLRGIFLKSKSCWRR